MSSEEQGILPEGDPVAPAKTPVERYVGFLETILDEEGIRPYGWTETEGDTPDAPAVAIYAGGVGVHEWFRAFWRIIGMPEKGDHPRVAFWGIDNTTSEGQGTEFADCYVFVQWTLPGPEVKLAAPANFRVGVINYQYEPLRIIREVDWSNKYWTGWMLGLLQQNHPGALVRVFKSQKGHRDE